MTKRRPLPRSLAMYIVKYEELRYVVAEHTADESLRLALVDTSFVFFHRAVAINISLTIGLGNCISRSTPRARGGRVQGCQVDHFWQPAPQGAAGIGAAMAVAQGAGDRPRHAQLRS